MDLPFADKLLAWRMRRSAARRTPPTVDELDLGQVRSVLLVLTTGLGDAVLSSAVFPNVRRALPQARIGLLVRDRWAGLFRADPDLDEVLEYRGKYRAWGATLARLKALAPDLALVLHGNDPDAIPLCVLAGARFIVRVPTAGTRYRYLLANRNRAQDADTVPGLHYVDNRLRVLDAVGIPATHRDPRLHLPADAPARLAQAVGELAGSDWIVYHAHSADAYKSWPAEQARAFLEGCARRFPGTYIALTGSGADRPALDALAQGLPTLNLAGRLSIDLTAALLAGARAVVAPDTGVMHLAAALGTPLVGLFSPTRAALVGPRPAGPRTRVIEVPTRRKPCLMGACPDLPRCCMAGIAPDTVLDAAAEAAGGVC